MTWTSYQRILTASHTVIATFISIVVGGCASNFHVADTQRECPYNGALNRKTNEYFDPGTIARPSPSPIVKIVRLTDDGELVDRCEWADVLTEIRANPTSRPDSNPPKSIVLYVHGWKHNGADDDSDLVEFTRLIEHLTPIESMGGNQRQVIGVFVAWPGQATKLPLAEELTFWDRKRAADRISQAGNVTKLIGAIANVRRQRANPGDFIVEIGHSFGARILYSSTSQLLLYELQAKHPGYREGKYDRIQGPADLIVLLNPAFEASTYTALDSTRRWQERFSEEQRPVLLTVSTTNDWATKTAFPMGQLFDLRWRERQLTTLGNYQHYFTHELRIRQPGEGHDGDPADTSPWYDNFCSGTVCLTRIDKLQPANPFLVATTSSDIIDGHNGIWNEPFIGWLINFTSEVGGGSTSSSR